MSSFKQRFIKGQHTNMNNKGQTMLTYMDGKEMAKKKRDEDDAVAALTPFLPSTLEHKQSGTKVSSMETEQLL